MNDRDGTTMVPATAAQPLQLIRSLEDMERVATFIAKSSLFGVKTPEQAMGLLLIAHAEGLHPASAAMSYHIIQNRPVLRTDAVLARHLASGGTVTWHERSGERASATFAYRGSSVTVTWTLATAKAAGLSGKDNWLAYPRQMLAARVIAEGVRAINPGVFVGVYTEEEVQDFSATPDVDAPPRLIPATVTSVPVPPPVEMTPTDWSVHESVALLTADDEARVILLEQVGKLISAYGEPAVADILRQAANKRLANNGPVLQESDISAALTAFKRKLKQSQPAQPLAEGA